MRSPWRWLVVAVVLIGLAYGFGFVTYRRSATDLPLLSTTKSNPGGPAMCPWRSPKADMQAFFPGSTDFTLHTLVLSRHRPEILKRLGPKYHMETTALYAYNVKQGAAPKGTVLVRRAAGEFGAIEVVVGVGLDGRVAGVRIQRQREPKTIAAAITSSGWLNAFKGKTSDSPITIGQDIPAAPVAAVRSATAVADTVRALLVEFEVSEGASKGTDPHPAGPH
jgi:hypothetical protein